MSKINLGTDHQKADEFARKAEQTRRKMNRRLEREIKERIRERNAQMVEAINLMNYGVCGPRGRVIV